MIAVLILAAGRARRFGGDKLLAPMGDRTVLDHVIEAAAPLTASRHAVVGPDDTGRAALLRSAGYQVHINPAPDAGQASSLQHGIDGIIRDNPDVEGVLILLGDMPFITTPLLSRLSNAGSPALCRSADVTSPPAFLPARLFEAARALSGDRGAAGMIVSDPAHRLIECDAAALRDIDRPADLAATS